jgi:hypothetical protein
MITTSLRILISFLVAALSSYAFALNIFARQQETGGS